MAFNCGRINLKLLLKLTKEPAQLKTKSYYWISYDGPMKIISTNPYEYLESEQMIIFETRNFIIDNKE